MRRFLFLGGLVGCASDQEIQSAADAPPVLPHAYSGETRVQVDTYRQVTKPQVDVLWVVDNSSSMGTEQDAITQNFPVFMEFFLGSSLDYHIGVISTDMLDPAQSGRLIEASGVRWIDEATPNPTDTFASMAGLGTGGSHSEEGILATYAAFELEQSWNDGFFREGSALQIIVVSDEQDQSPDQPVTNDEFIAYLAGLRADPEMITFSSIVSPLAPEFPCDGASTSGSRYLRVTDAIGGVKWSVCDHDWVQVLELLGLQSVGLKREYFLSERPVDGTVEVAVVDAAGTEFEFAEVDPVAGTGDWVWSDPRNSVTFLDFVPQEGASVRITYDVLSAIERD